MARLTPVCRAPCRKVGQIEEQRHFVSSARLISLLTLASRVLGVVRDAVCLGWFGTAVWHYFTVPFMIPNLFRRLFGEGALSAALIPVYTQQLQDDEQKARLLARSVVTLLFVVLTLLTLLGLAVVYGWLRLGAVGNKGAFTLFMAGLMLPYMVLICMVAVIGGLLNVHRHFAAPAAAPIVLNVCIILAAVCCRRWFGETRWEQVCGVAAAVLVAGVLQLLLQYPAMRRVGLVLRPRFRFSDVGLGRVLRMMGPMLIGLSAMQINALLDFVIAFALSATPENGGTFILAGREFAYPVAEGSASFLYGAQRLYQFPLGVFGIALATAVFPLLSRYAAQKDNEGFARTLTQGLRLVIFVGVPATVGMIMVRVPLVATLFERGRFTQADTQATAWTLLFYASGIAAYCLQHVVVRAYYAYQDSVTPVKIALRMMVLNLVLNMILIWWLGTGGLALSTAICATIQVGVLLWLLVRRHELRLSGGIVSCVVKTVVAAVVMAVGCYVVLSLLDGRSAVWQLAGGVVVSAALFAGMSLLLRNEELKALLRR